MVEKPLALQLDEAIQIKEAMKGISVKVFTCLHLRHSFQVQKLKAIIDSEKFGEVVGLQSVLQTMLIEGKLFLDTRKKEILVVGYYMTWLTTMLIYLVDKVIFTSGY